MKLISIRGLHRTRETHSGPAAFLNLRSLILLLLVTAIASLPIVSADISKSMAAKLGSQVAGLQPSGKPPVTKPASMLVREARLLDSNQQAVLSSQAFTPQSAFTPGDLVVMRFGTGGGALNANATAAFLDEYTTNGILVQSIALPTSPSGLNRTFTVSGSATSEGQLTQSTNGQYLVAAGYDAAVGTTSITTSTSATVNRVIARINANGTIDTTTALTDAISGGNPRGAATTDGNDLWISGTSSAGGIRHATFGQTTSQALGTAPTTNIRHTGIFNGQLYVTSASSTIRLATVGTGTPTSGAQTITQLPGLPTTLVSPYGFFFADLDAGVPGPDTLYITDDGTGATGGILKFCLVGGLWTARGSVTSTAAVRGLTGKVTGSSVTLYAGGNTSLVTLTDNSGYNVNISGSISSLATALPNTAFRGVAFVPSGGSTNPSGAGAANPSTVNPGDQPLLTVTVTLGANPTSSGITVTTDLTGIGGSASQTFFDDGTNGDVTPGDNIFSFQPTVDLATSGGTKNLPFNIADAEGRNGSGTISLTVNASTNPSGVGSATPTPVAAGQSTLLKVTVTPGTNPASTLLAVSANLSSIGGSATQQFFDDGTNGDVTSGDHVFSFLAPIPIATPTGPKTLPFTISDSQLRTGTGSISLTVSAPSVPPGTIVMSQVYGGGGNAGATLKNDYIELFNRSQSTVNITGWSLQRLTSAGTGPWEQTILSGTIQPGQYILVQEAAGAGGSVNLPTPDITGTMTLGAGAGILALVNNSALLAPGACPSIGTNLIDLIGYGAAACFETTPSATLGNTTAALRTHGGCKDTDNNSLDFKVIQPAPRNSASPLNVCTPGDLAPEVFNTTPTDGSSSNPVNTTITVTFDEPVNVTASWFTISCATSGSHTATFNGGPSTFTIIPDVAFGSLEQCTVTILANQVTDQDAIDPPDNMAANYVFSFLTATDGSEHLLFGNPSGATSDPINFFENYLMTKPQYALSYNGTKGTPNWTSWHLDSTWLGSAPRQDDFRNDTSLPPNFYQVLGTDYSGSGFDRGHSCPSADRTSTILDNSATFLMTNMTPQAPANNQGPFGDFENYLRTQVTAGNELYIVTGPAGIGGTGSGGFKTTIANGHVTVPAYSWKVALILPVGDNDLSRVDTSTRTLAIIIPNNQSIVNINDPWQKYIATVDQVEALTGYDFFSNVPVSIQNTIEARLDAANDTAPVANSQSVSATEDTPLAITLTATDFNINNQFTYAITNGPSHGILSGTGANLTYTPTADYFGPDTFTFKVNDGALDSQEATVTISVSEVNDSPTTVADSKTMDWNSTLSFPSSDLTANDSAGPNEGAQSLTVTTVTSTADTHGSVTLNAGTVSYTPNNNFFGPASFSYTVCDNGTTNGNPDPKCATGTVNVTVNLVDVTPPTVTVPSDITKEATGPNGAAATFTVSANDNIDGPVPTTCDHQSGDVFPLGTTLVSCSATDAHNNTGNATFNVIVVDTTAPSITVPGNITVEATGPGGASVTFSVSATDIVDGSVGVSCDHTSGSTFAIVTTTVNCSAMDAHHNSSSRSFSITVQDTTAPSITVPGNITVEATGPAGATVTFTASASDSVDGPLPATCDHTSGSVFALGTTTVNCSATDAHNNSASASFTVTVRDTTPPIVMVPGNITVEATGSGGATVTFTVSASDLVSGALTPNCNHPSGTVFAIGTTTVACSATDTHSNTGSASFTVTVQDTTGPVLTLPANITVQATSNAGAVVTFVATAQDSVSGPLPVNCVPASGSTFPIGTTVVNCSATDTHINTTTGSFTVTVTVPSPRQVKQQVLADMNALLATLTDKDDKKKLGKAIDDLADSLNPSYWVDDNHLQPKKGQKVFNNEQDSVDVLAKLIKNKNSVIPDAVLQGFIDRQVAADRALAQTAIDDATAAHGDANKLAEAREDIQSGDTFNAAGKPDKAIGQYRDAWKDALKSLNIDCDD